MQSIRLYDISSGGAEENAERLYNPRRRLFYWNMRAFGNIEAGDLIFVNNNKAGIIFLATVDKIGLKAEEGKTDARFFDLNKSYVVSGTSWGDFCRLRIIETVTTNGALDFRLKQNRVTILYDAKRRMPLAISPLQPDRIRILKKYFQSGIAREALRAISKYSRSSDERSGYFASDRKNNSIAPTQKRSGPVEQMLKRFSFEADSWFAEQTWLDERFRFFKRFFRKNNLDSVLWSGLREIGDNLHCFNGNPIARQNALGRRNHPISHYRKSLQYLRYSREPLETRIDRLLVKDSPLALKYFSRSSISELVSYAFPERYVMFNKRTEQALRFIDIEIHRTWGESFGSYFVRYNETIQPILRSYERIVGKRTRTTIPLEVDQFFSWLYNRYVKDTAEQIPPLTIEENNEEVQSPASEEIHLGADKTSISYPEPKPYSHRQLKKDLFLDLSYFKKIAEIIRRKKNIVIQGPPGVGKTYAARRIAYAIIGKSDINRVKVVQFHQSYSYEDFIHGIRPNKTNGFELTKGVFYEFCDTAQHDPENDYFFIIDEINRGNLAKIFGELMMLIEADKRGREHAMPLLYAEKDTSFYVPENVHLIGTMNTADRSLSIVDHALRRRFAFFDFEPCFDDRLVKHLNEQGLDDDFAREVCTRMSTLNDIIEKDERRLGKAFRIGHSYFCKPDVNDPKKWFNDVIEFEIRPLLNAYWFNEEKKAGAEATKLRID